MGGRAGWCEREQDRTSRRRLSAVCDKLFTGYLSTGIDSETVRIVTDIVNKVDRWGEANRAFIVTHLFSLSMIE